VLLRGLIDVSSSGLSAAVRWIANCNLQTLIGLVIQYLDSSFILGGGLKVRLFGQLWFVETWGETTRLRCT
jgi:hypothetical protein